MGYVSEPIQYRCGPPSGAGSYRVGWTAEVTLPAGAEPALLYTSDAGTQILSYEQSLFRREKDSDQLLTRASAAGDMDCGSLGEDESGTTTSGGETESSSDTDGDGCTTEEVGGLLGGFIGPISVGSVVDRVQNSIGTVDSGDTTKTCMQCGKFIHRDDHAHTCGTAGFRLPTNQPLWTTRWTAGDLTADRSPLEALECGLAGDTTTLCPPGALIMDPGEYVVLTHVVRDTTGRGSTTRSPPGTQSRRSRPDYGPLTGVCDATSGEVISPRSPSARGPIRAGNRCRW